MQAISYYLTYPFIYLIASLPFGVLYKVSDVLFHLLWISGYRKRVVFNNLKNSFPDKSISEIKVIQKEFFRYLCDLVLETLKTLKMTEEEARERCVFNNSAWIDSMHRRKQSFIIVLGHYGNWEWAGPSFTLGTDYQLVVIYRPLSNTYFEKMMFGMRTKFGTKITAAPQTLRDMISNRKNITATAFIADQTASPEIAYWTTFLHQDTPVFTGPEKLAIKFDYPVVYMNIQRERRGFYSVTPELLFERPKDTQPGEISERFTRRLESDIINNPSIWLWSHKRWKHRKSSSNNA